MFVGSVNVMVVGTNSPLILLMPEVGLLYILSSSDPLCGGEGHVRSGSLNTRTKPNTAPTLISVTCPDVSLLLEVHLVPQHSQKLSPALRNASFI